MTDQDKALYLSMRGQSDIVKDETKQIPLNFFNNGIDLEQCKMLSFKPYMKAIGTYKVRKIKEKPTTKRVKMKSRKRRGRKTPKPWKSTWTEFETNIVIKMRDANIAYSVIGCLLGRTENSIKGKYYAIKND